MLKNISKYILISLFFAVLVIFLKDKALAKEINQPENQILKIAPIILDLNLENEKKQEYKIKIENLLDAPLGVKLSLETLNASDEITGMQFGLPEENSPLLSWITMSKNEFIIQERNSETITIIVNVPKNTKKGSYYGILFATPYFTKPLDKLSPTVVSRIGTLLLANIGKPYKEKASKMALVEELKLENALNNSVNKNLIVRVKNTYPYHLSVKPFIEISSIFGKEPKIEFEDKRVLPDKIRKWSKTLKLKTGIYQVKAAISLKGGEYIYAKKTFVVFPIKEFTIILIISICLALAFILRKRLKKAIFILFKGK